MLARLKFVNLSTTILSRNFKQSVILNTTQNDGTETKIGLESERMKKFHEKLKLQPVPRIGPAMRFVDLVLVETDPQSGELITDSEKDPTKWGDWQIGGRVTDF